MGASKKVDANDVLAQHGAGVLREILDAQAVASQSAKATKRPSKPNGSKESSKERRIKAKPYVACDPRTLPPDEWLYGRLLVRGYLTMTVAPGGVGKSTLAIGEAVALAAGLELHHDAPFEAMKVWYVNGEDPEILLRKKVEAIRLRYDLPPEKIGGRLFLTGKEDFAHKFARLAKNGIEVDEDLVEDIVAEIRENGISVLILDPFASFHAANENDNSQMEQVVRLLSSIATQTNCAVHLIHHTRKAPSTPGYEATADDVRGASAVVAAARIVRLVQPMSKDEAEKLRGADRKRYFQTNMGKINLAPQPEKGTWYCLESQLLGNDTPERPSDNIGVVTPWSYPSAGGKDGMDPELLRAVQAKVRAGEGKYREDVRATDWVGKHIASIFGVNFTDPRDKRKLQKHIQDMIESGVLVSVERLGPDRKPTKFIEVGEPV